MHAVDTNITAELNDVALADGVEFEMGNWLKFACEAEGAKKYYGREDHEYSDVCDKYSQNVVSQLQAQWAGRRALDLASRLEAAIPELKELDQPSIPVTA